MLYATGWIRWEWYLVTELLPNLGYEWIGISESLACVSADLLKPSVLTDPHAFKVWVSVLNLGFLLPVTIIVLLLSSRILKEWLHLGVVFVGLSLPLLTPLLEYHHIVWAFVSYLFIIRLWLSGRINAIFYMQLPLWLVILAAGHLADLGFKFGSRGAGALAMLTILVLWLINGSALVWLRFAGKEKHVA